MAAILAPPAIARPISGGSRTERVSNASMTPASVAIHGEWRVKPRRVGSKQARPRCERETGSETGVFYEGLDRRGHCTERDMPFIAAGDGTQRFSEDCRGGRPVVPVHGDAGHPVPFNPAERLTTDLLDVLR